MIHDEACFISLKSIRSDELNTAHHNHGKCTSKCIFTLDSFDIRSATADRQFHTLN